MNGSINEMIYNFFQTYLSTFKMIFIILSVYGFIAYFFKSFALVKLANKKDIKRKWSFFIPFAKTYTYGKLAFNKKWKSILFTFFSVLVFAGLVIGFIADHTIKPTPILDNYVAGLNFDIQLLVYFIFYICAAYKIYKQFSDKAVVMTIFSILSLGFLSPIFIFSIRNNELKKL